MPVRAFSASTRSRARPRGTCVAEWPPGELYTSTSATPAYAGGMDLRFALNNLDIDIRYVALIGTSP